MIEIKVATQIDASINRVWDIVSNLEDERRYWRGLKSIKTISVDGDVVTREVTIGKVDKCRQIVTLFPKSSIKIEYVDGVITGTREVKLIPLGDKTILEVYMRFNLSGLAGFLSGRIRNDLHQEADEAVHLIKNTAEGKSEEAIMVERITWADLIKSYNK